MNSNPYTNDMKKASPSPIKLKDRVKFEDQYSDAGYGIEASRKLGSKMGQNKAVDSDEEEGGGHVRTVSPRTGTYLAEGMSETKTSTCFVDFNSLLTVQVSFVSL